MPLAGTSPTRRFTFTRNGRVLVARFSNPPHNFLDGVAAAELDSLVRAVDRDATVGAVVLTGEPADLFITHFDAVELAAAGRFPVPALPMVAGDLLVGAGLASTLTPLGRAVARRCGPVGRALVTLQHLHRFVRGAHRSSAVWIAAIDGPCLGGGLEVALACDLRLAADVPRVVLGSPEVLTGILPGGGATQHLPRIIGTARTVELVLEGTQLSAAEAARLGLVRAAVPPDDLLDTAIALGSRLANRAPAAVAAAKRAVHLGATHGLGRGLRIEAGGLVAAGTSRESRRLADVFEAELARLGRSPFLAEPERWSAGDPAGIGAVRQ
jgi:enoyl-CoA hydratase/carnithine racemase